MGVSREEHPVGLLRGHLGLPGLLHAGRPADPAEWLHARPVSPSAALASVEARCFFFLGGGRYHFSGLAMVTRGPFQRKIVFQGRLHISWWEGTLFTPKGRGSAFGDARMGRRLAQAWALLMSCSWGGC